GCDDLPRAATSLMGVAALFWGDCAFRPKTCARFPAQLLADLGAHRSADSSLGRKTLPRAPKWIAAHPCIASCSQRRTTVSWFRSCCTPFQMNPAADAKTSLERKS